MRKTGLITGVTGQDGSYLAELLLEKGYTMHGINRHASSLNTSRIDHLYEDPHESPPRLVLHYGDLTDSTNLIRIIEQVQPDEIYNLGAQSHVALSLEAPECTANSDALGTLRILEAVRMLRLTAKTRIYQTSTSELYGLVQAIPQKETTSFYPRSPYGAAKLYAYWITVKYCETYGMYACNGLLFNHELPLLGKTCITRKIPAGWPRWVGRLINHVDKISLADRFYFPFNEDYTLFDRFSNVNEIYRLMEERDLFAVHPVKLSKLD